MSEFPLRPVSQLSHSRTPTPSPMSPTTSVRMPPLLLPHDAPSASARGGPPRPWTPSSLNDVDLTAAHEQGSAPPRRYPAPPTGHDLMALFPPVPPATIKDPAGALPTSGWFERQERAFFARAGAEIVRVRKDGAQPQEKRATQPQDGAKVGMNGSPRVWPHSASPPLLLPLGTNPPAPPHIPHGGHSKSRSLHHHPHPHPSPPDPRAPHLSPVQPTSPMHQNHSGSSPSTLSAHSRSPPNPHAQSYPGGKQEPSEDGYDDPEEAWRKPMPHAERRRAGKHTKRVIVRT